MNLPQNDPTSGAGAAPPRPGNGTNSAARPAPRPAPRVVRAGLGPPAAPSANSTLSNPLSVIAGAFQGALYQRSKKDLVECFFDASDAKLTLMIVGGAS